MPRRISAIAIVSIERCFIERSVCLIVVAGLAGCGEKVSSVDDAPFRQAIVEYLERNNMALVIKDIKTGPTTDGDHARLSASLTHEQLGGPSVTWEFEFAKQPDGSWLVTSHED